MSKYYIVNEQDKLWLVNSDTNSVEYLDKDVIGSMSAAGLEFLAIMGMSEETGNDMEARTDPSDRAYSFDGRSDASDRAYSFDGRSDASDRAYSFDGRSDASDRAYSFDGRSDASDRAYSFDGRSIPSDRAYSSDANPAAAN